MSKENYSVPTQVHDSNASQSAGENQSDNSNIVTQNINIIGTILLNRYLIEKKIGDGGFGSVFLALDQRLVDKPVVIKVLERLENEWIVQKFQQEREALARIEHSGVVGILDAGTLDNGQPFIVMQYIDGITLRDVMKEGELSIERIGNIVEQATMALSAAHHKNILHRDLKPENIMLQKGNAKTEQVKVIDFGIAKVAKSKVAESTVGGFSAGTLYYLPPETLQGQQYTESSDIYVLATIIYEMLTGFRPFRPDTDNPLLFPPKLLDLQQEGVSQPRNSRPELSVQAENILLKALAFDSADRYQDIAEFGDDFVKALKSEVDTLDKTQLYTPQAPKNEPKAFETNKTVSAISTNLTTSSPERKSKKNRDIVLAVAALIIIFPLTIFGIWYLFQNDFFGSDRKPSVPVASAVDKEEVSLRYWLEIQKMRNGKPYQETFKASGQEIFENGYEFKFFISSKKDGYLYFFSEGINEDKGSYWILFPTPIQNEGEAKIESDAELESGWNVFSGEAGTEKFWLIWTEDEIEVLEDARINAFDSDDGSIGDEKIKKDFEEFLASNSDQKLTVEKQEEDKETSIKGTGKIIVKQLKMEHR